jgi:hypothetical protein
MSKGFDEIAGDILASLLKARGEAIASSDNNTNRNYLVETFLSDEAVSSAYVKIYKSVIEALKSN